MLAWPNALTCPALLWLFLLITGNICAAAVAAMLDNEKDGWLCTTAKACLPARLSARVLARRGSNPPAHLDGSLPGDFGWDPLGLGADPDRLKWFAEVRPLSKLWSSCACWVLS